MNKNKLTSLITKYPITVSFNLLLISWTLIIFGIIYWSWNSIENETYNLARREAFKGYEKDVMFRSWATVHGGVYVPATNETPPNPYLANIPERDIVTPSGKKLTLMNPAYITREVHELSFKKIGIRGHITSLKPIREQNSPDGWETKALRLFDSGVKDFSGFDYINGEKYFRYMAPLRTEKGCLKCHEVQGYKVGEIRGGISSTIPWKTYQTSINKQLSNVLTGYGILWLIGFAGIYSVKRKFIIYIIRRDSDEYEMKKLNEELRYSNILIEENLKERNTFIEEIEGANKKLHKLNSEKDKFFSIIAHDLKSPFSSLIGITEILAEDSEEFSAEERKKINYELNTSAKNLYKLLQNLLEWSQMQNGTMSFHPHKINLTEVIKQNADILGYRLKNKNIGLAFDKVNDIFVSADENMINSIIRNILSNAIKFSKRDSSIVFSFKETDSGMIEVSIKDSGIGIPENIKVKLFKMEEKVGRPGLDGEKSTGLGLLLCKEFVEKHGGNIWVESKEGEGSIF